MTVTVERIELSTPYRSYRDQKCTKVIQTSGVAFDGKRKRTCDRRAMFKLKGDKFCVQHAGETALKHLIENQRDGSV